jgi:protein-S-isoprenylcysteine O-methyltransferase Ste14
MDQKVSHIAMYILAITLIGSVAIVLGFKGIDSVPHQWIGVAVAGVLAIAALAMTRLKFDH